MKFFIHNLVGHPLMAIFHAIGLKKVGDYFHDITLPRKTKLYFNQIKKISQRDLKFPIDPMWPKKSNIFSRYYARKVAAKILNDKCSSYQFFGIGYSNLDEPKEQLAHWILRNEGYSVCVADLLTLQGKDPDRREEKDETHENTHANGSYKPNGTINRDNPPQQKQNPEPTPPKMQNI